MGVNVHVDLSANIQGKLQRGQRLAGNQVMLEMSQYVPRREGHLRDSATMSLDGKTIRYHEPYAKAQFYGFIGKSRIHNYTEPGTGRRWDLRMKGNSSKMSKIKHAFTKGAGF